MMKVLIVEDNYAMRHLIRGIVGDLAEVFDCADGAEALSRYEQHRPDWVFIDVRMQNLNGIDVTRDLIAAHAEARVVIVASADNDRLPESAQAAGACGYVLKEDLFSLRRLLTAAPGSVRSQHQ